MRLVIDAHGTRHEVTVAQVADEARLADLVESCSGVPVAPDEVWWVDDTEHRGDELVRDLLLLDGSVLSGSRSTAVEPIKGWSVSMSGGPDAGVTVAVPLDRPLVIGRSPQADLQIDSPSLPGPT